MFLLLGFPIWVLGIELALFIAWTILVQVEYYGWSTLVCILSIASLQFVLKIGVFTFIKDNPGLIGLYAFGWAVCGLLWSFVKWASFLFRFKEERENKLEEFKNSQARRQKDFDEREVRERRGEDVRLSLLNPDKSDSDSRERVEINRERERRLEIFKSQNDYTEFDYLSSCKYKNTHLNESPKFRDYKGKITAWVIFWIPSLIGTLLDDFVRKLVEFIVQRFRAAYQALSNKIVGDFPKTEIESEKE